MYCVSLGLDQPLLPPSREIKSLQALHNFLVCPTLLCLLCPFAAVPTAWWWVWSTLRRWECFLLADFFMWDQQKNPPNRLIGFVDMQPLEPTQDLDHGHVFLAMSECNECWLWEHYILHHNKKFYCYFFRSWSQEEREAGHKEQDHV